MATIKRELSPKVRADGKREIIIRVSVCRGLQPRIKTGLFISPNRFNSGDKDPVKAGVFIYPRANQKEAAELRALESNLISVEQHLIELCSTTPKEDLSKGLITDAFNRYQHPELFGESNETKKGFYDIFDNFISSRNLSEWRIKRYNVLKRALQRFELYTRAVSDENYNINLNSLSAVDISRFESFLRNEPEISVKYPEIYESFPADGHKVRKTPKPHPKGNNTIVNLFSALRAFFNWCNSQGLTGNKPFAKYTGITTEKYGTPYYLTTSERDIIACWDFSKNKALQTQRDIFIFHCYIGCRVSDLMRLTDANVINGGIEYIATKTKSDHPEVIRVPLHPVAATLVEKYQGGKTLFPFITPQRYNDAIKEIFTICGITRSVTILNPTTGDEEQRPINQIASSHIARRTFVGNLYKQVKDPNLVGKLSGHKEGSKAFARYRDIDEDMKKELINLL